MFSAQSCGSEGVSLEDHLVAYAKQSHELHKYSNLRYLIFRGTFFFAHQPSGRQLAYLNYHLIHPPTPSVTNRPVARLSPLVLKKCISLALKNSLRITIRSQSFIFEHKPSAWSATNSP
ncbi:hypothetical protein PGT21_034543 [Puccinia graminis f. sp. tritici]|uniref:Uncharacterized protein n=1 Tax=Puccinia graminis f. sp. tritici TaxID=56615 RepID=A0A5B0N016_PUCGR|nr:hypothetical protein PGT21_034543 [Puccinia graminis f. sp. tritici]KAA1081774.1 hypothetical protein PGTUg99_005236 [Puccinia graminis f. sp. tritici]